MELTWPEECWIKFCRQLIRERFLDNYYSVITLFMNWYNRFLPLLWQFVDIKDDSQLQTIVATVSKWQCQSHATMLCLFLQLIYSADTLCSPLSVFACNVSLWYFVLGTSCTRFIQKVICFSQNSHFLYTARQNQTLKGITVVK